MTNPAAKHRWFYPTPGWLIPALLAVECLLWLSERFQWFGFNRHKGWTVLIAVAVVGVAFLVMLVWFFASLVFSWRFQFSIRSLLLMVVAVAVPCSWLGVEMKAAREQEKAVDELTTLHEFVQYDWQLIADGTLPPNAQPPGPEWLRKLLGSDFFTSVVLVVCNYEKTDAGLAHLAGLTQLYDLNLDKTQITDAGLVHLVGLTHLQGLCLGNTQITDAGLLHLAGLTQLQRLILDNTRITDAGLVHLARLTQLQELLLDNTQITDAGLAHIAGLTRLQLLGLNDTQVTDEGVKKLQEALPNCTIIH